MSRRQTEAMSVDAIRAEIHKHPGLVDHLAEGDKGISWDGFIEVFSHMVGSDPMVAQYIGEIKVQIKGTRIANDCPFCGRELKQSVRVTDIENYQREGKGTLYFVVQVKENGESRIFYRALLPYEIKLILDTASGQKTVTVSFLELDTSVFNFYELCRSVLVDMKTQLGKKIAVYSAPIQSLDRQGIEEITLLGRFDITGPEPSFRFSPLHAQLQEKQRIYFRSGDTLTIAEVDDFSISPNMPLQVYVEGIMFYDDARYILTDRGNKTIFGNEILLSNDGISFSFDSSVEAARRDIDFLLFLNGKDIEVYLNGRLVVLGQGVLFGQDIIDSLLMKRAQLHKMITTLDKFNIPLDISLDKASGQDYAVLQFLGNENRTYGDKHNFHFAEIAGREIVFFICKSEDGKSTVFNPFASGMEHLKFSYPGEGDDKKIAGSVFWFLLSDKRILKCWNFDPAFILIDIRRYAFNEVLGDLVADRALSLLHYFDAHPERFDVLSLAEGLFEWQLRKSKDAVIPTINVYQSILRRRELSGDEKHILSALPDGNALVKLCKSILLGNRYDCEMCFKQLSKTEITSFWGWPIASICKWLPAGI